MCNHNCNQGRNCTCRQGGEIAIATLIILTSLMTLTPWFVQMMATPEPRCWGGWLYDGMNGRQIFNENGGGIKCTT